MKLNSVLGKFIEMVNDSNIKKHIIENSEIFFNEISLGILLVRASLLCPVLCRDIIILDDYLTPRNGEQDISQKCNEAGNEYLLALGTVSSF